MFLDKLKDITGKEIKFYELDVCDRDGLRDIFSKENIDAVIHFAGYKAVGESVSKPWEYYNNNISALKAYYGENYEDYIFCRWMFLGDRTLYGAV